MNHHTDVSLENLQLITFSESNVEFLPSMGASKKHENLERIRYQNIFYVAKPKQEKYGNNS